MDFLPNVPVILNIQYGWIPEDFFEFYDVAPLMFKNRDLTCYFLINGGIFITNMVILTMFWGVLLWLNSVMNFRNPASSPAGTRALLRKTLESMEYNVYIRYLLQAYLEFGLAVFL